MPIRHILVVDDSRTELHHLSTILARQGYHVRAAENANEALARLAESLPDLILMDVVMPGTNGYQLTRSITRDPRWSGVPVILCTSKGLDADRVWGMRQGAQDYLVKPVEARTLLRCIAELEQRQDAAGSQSVAAAGTAHAATRSPKVLQ